MPASDQAAEQQLSFRRTRARPLIRSMCVGKIEAVRRKRADGLVGYKEPSGRGNSANRPAVKALVIPPKNPAPWSGIGNRQGADIQDQQDDDQQDGKCRDCQPNPTVRVLVERVFGTGLDIRSDLKTFLNV